MAANGSQPDQAGVMNLDAIKASVLKLPDGKVRQAVQVALAEAGGSLEGARKSLEAWFDGTMDRVSGWYKRETQWILFAIGLACAMAPNINTLDITREMATNNTVRQSMLAGIDARYPDLNVADVHQLNGGMLKGDLSEVIGWSHVKFPSGALPATGYALELLLGWVLTAIAVSLGAPFWFDLLNKFIVVRST